MGAQGIITLTTDFGHDDGYVAAMKGVILGIAPGVSVVDVTHTLPPQDIAAAAFILSTAVPYFPPDAVHLAVVDPGVGTGRKAIAVAGSRGTFVGPDNGLFAPLLSAEGAIQAGTGKLIHGEAVELTSPRFRRPVVSATFHGRDIFAPAAAHIVAGTPLAELGPAVRSIATARAGSPARAGDCIHGTVWHVDHFGNLITNITAGSLPRAPLIRVADQTLLGVAGNYQERELAALIGSNGYLEIAARNGSAASLLAMKRGDAVVVCPQRDEERS